MAEYTCLVVEDSPMMRQLVVFALARIRNLVVVEADDGVDGLRKLASRRFDLVITDINMPIMDGLKLIKRIRTDAVHKDVPIIIITTEGSNEDRQRALTLGANLYITKPIQAPQVIAKVKELLGMEHATMLIKVCGITRLDDALACADAGVDAIGLNFWPGTRRCVSIAEGDAIITSLRGRGHETRVYGVFVDALEDEIEACLGKVALDGVQLHGHEPPELVASLRASVFAFKAIRASGPEAIVEARRYRGDLLLVDASVPGRAGGTGVLADLDVAAVIASERKVILAGGLRPENVVAAIERVAPAGVDAASGVEEDGAPRGEKDSSRVRAFVDAVRRLQSGSSGQ